MSIYENGRYLKSIIDNSVIVCDKIIYATDSVSTNMTNTISTNVTNTLPTNITKTLPTNFMSIVFITKKSKI